MCTLKVQRQLSDVHDVYGNWRVNMNAVNEMIIASAFEDVDFQYYDQVLEASKKLSDVDGSEVVEWISDQLEQHWHYTEILNGAGVQNVENIFEHKFDLGVLINSYFTITDHWYFYTHGPRWHARWIDEFNELSGLHITADDVTKFIDLDFLIDSHAYGPGFNEFIEFLEDTGGDIKLFIQKIAPAIDRLPHIDVEDIVLYLTPYLEPGDIDMEKLFSRIDWDLVEDFGYYPQFIEFFEKFAPELAHQIPF